MILKMTLSEYLTESILSKKTGQYKKDGPLIFDKGYTDTEYQDAIDNILNAGGHLFWTSKGASFQKTIDMRTSKYNFDFPEYCLYPDSNVQPTIIVIEGGPLAKGKRACALRYHKDEPIVKKNTRTTLVATHFYEYDGKMWKTISQPTLGGSKHDPREHKDEINSMLDK
jgi:hypothetical protein